MNIKSMNEGFSKLFESFKNKKHEENMDELFDVKPDIDLNLDASGQSVGIAGGTGSTGGFKSVHEKCDECDECDEAVSELALAGLAGAGAGVIGSKLLDGYDREETAKKLHEIADKMDEAQMSPEDEADSALIRSAIKKLEKRANARFTPEEQAVLDKYGIKRSSSS